ncbi:MAG TPA: hypothetical protein VM390_07460, partial [Acidimicrobiales bacterium]|nr:hypothetical protein [Acidimicrobiales bacterium]
SSSRSPSTLRRLLDQAERELEAATQARDALSAALTAAPPADHVALAALAQDLARAEARVAEAEERWLSAADELEGGQEST